MARLTSLLLLGAMGVSAQPHGHGHAHLHQKQRDVQPEERDIGDVIVATMGGDVVSWTQTEDYFAVAATLVVNSGNTATSAASVSATPTYAATTLATSTATSAAATATASSSSSSSSSSGSGVDSYTSFSDYCATYSSSSSKKRATYAQITQEGNVGDPYNCNMMLISSEEVASQYNNTAKFFGATEDVTCAYWNKISISGALNGWYKSEDSYQTFDLAAGAVQYIAFDDGSQGGAACFPSSSGLSWDEYGGLLGTWTEWGFNDVTTGWSGADASSIQAEAAGATIYGLEVCNADDTSATCSTISSGGSIITNAFNYALKAADGLGLNQEGSMKITVNLGY